MKINKLIDNKRLRVWFYPVNQGWGIHKKVFKRLGWVFFMGRFRVSCTILKNKPLLYNKLYKFEKID